MGRLASLLLDGRPRPITFALWGPELVGLMVALAAWRRLARLDADASA